MERDFEVRLLISGIVKMFHFRDLRNQDQADKRAKKLAKKKNGRVISVRKVNVDDWPSGIEFMRLERQPRGLYLGNKVWEADISRGGDLDIDRVLGLRKDNKNRKKNH